MLEGRDNERYRRAILTTATSIIAKGVSVLTGIFTVPLTLNYLGTERYGMWMTISSVMIMLVFADFGLGNGLINAVSKAYGTDDRLAAKKSVSSVFIILTLSAIILSIGFAICYNIIPWSRIFNVTSSLAIQESGPAVVVFFSCFALNLPLGIVQRVQLGYQEGYQNNFWQIAGNVLGMFGLLLAIYLKAGLPWLVFAMSGIPSLIMILNWLYQFFYVRPWLKPKLSNFEWEIGKALMKTGLIFSLITLANIIGSSLDNIIIAQYLGASEVATYSVLQKLFSIMYIVPFATAPLWPAFSEAIARRDYFWAQRTFKHALILTVWMTVIICLPLMLFGQTIIKIWAGPLVIPSMSFVIGFTFFWLASGLAQAPIPVMQTEFFIRRLLLITVIYSIISVVLKIAFVPVWHLAGIAWAGALAYGLFFVVPAIIITYRGLNKQAVAT